ncbi:MAG: hypothetical protein HQL31_10300, partial [Planctomycetes bacterium]|nr:hypothetical protein [Planctomycetota bacterium]
ARLQENKPWKYIFLVTSRVLLGLALGYAFARPFLVNSVQNSVGGDQVHHVILLDNSYSMSHQVRGESVFQTRLALLGKMTDRWQRGEEYSVYTLAGGLEPLVEKQRKSDDRQLRETLGEVKLVDGTISMADAIDGVLQRCGRQRLEVILLADQQKLNWKEGAVPPKPEGCSFLWLQSAEPPPANLFLTGLSLPGEVVVQGDLVPVVARVQCSAAAPGPQPVTCELFVAGQGLQRRSATVLPGQVRDIAFDVKFSKAGAQSVKAEIKNPDGIEWDNQITASLLVRRELRVLVLADRPARAFDNAGDYLGLALSAESSEAGLRVVCGKTSELGKLDGYDVVFLDNPVELTSQHRQALAAFVERGGGLVLGCGTNLKPSPVKENDAMASFLPVRFLNKTLLPLNGPEFFSVQLSSLLPPVFSSLSSKDADGLKGIKFYGCWQTEVLPEAEVLGRLDNGAPWLVGKSWGFGRIIAMSSGLSGQWNNLPVSGSYVHFLYRLMAYASAGSTLPLNLPRGGEVAVRRRASDLYTLFGPLGSESLGVTLPLSNVTRHAEPLAVCAAGLASNGQYVVRSADGKDSAETLISIYDGREEGEVQALTELEVTKLQQVGGWEIIRDARMLDEFLRKQAGGQEIYAWLIGAWLALLFVESWLSWKVGS